MIKKKSLKCYNGFESVLNRKFVNQLQIVSSHCQIFKKYCTLSYTQFTKDVLFIFQPSFLMIFSTSLIQIVVVSHHKTSFVNHPHIHVEFKLKFEQRNYYESVLYFKQIKSLNLFIRVAKMYREVYKSRKKTCSVFISHLTCPKNHLMEIDNT